MEYKILLLIVMVVDCNILKFNENRSKKDIEGVSTLKYTTPGNYVLTPKDYNYVEKIEVEIWGAGGGGDIDGAGGSGGYMRTFLNTNQEKFNITIGMGGLIGNPNEEIVQEYGGNGSDSVVEKITSIPFRKEGVIAYGGNAGKCRTYTDGCGYGAFESVHHYYKDGKITSDKGYPGRNGQKTVVGYYDVSHVHTYLSNGKGGNAINGGSGSPPCIDNLLRYNYMNPGGGSGGMVNSPGCCGICCEINKNMKEIIKTAGNGTVIIYFNGTKKTTGTTDITGMSSVDITGMSTVDITTGTTSSKINVSTGTTMDVTTSATKDGSTHTTIDITTYSGETTSQETDGEIDNDMIYFVTLVLIFAMIGTLIFLVFMKNIKKITCNKNMNELYDV
jgi:hypothetical protein